MSKKTQFNGWWKIKPIKLKTKFDYFDDFFKDIEDVPVMKYKTIFDKKGEKDEKNS